MKVYSALRSYWGSGPQGSVARRAWPVKEDEGQVPSPIVQVEGAELYCIFQAAAQSQFAGSCSRSLQAAVESQCS